MSLEHIKLSQQAKDQLIAVKRRTGVKNWNVLCRWALCTSLAENSDPPDAEIPADSSVEMTWKIFSGEYGDVYLALLKERSRKNGRGATDGELSRYFRLHLHRGIGYLFGDRSIQSIDHLVARAVERAS
jgi:DNA sulfur modification protein DndE